MGEGNSEIAENQGTPEVTPSESSKSFLEKAKKAADRVLNLYGTKTGTAFMTAFNSFAGTMIVRDIMNGEVKKALIGLPGVAVVNYLTLHKPPPEQPRDARGRFTRGENKETPK